MSHLTGRQSLIGPALCAGVAVLACAALAAPAGAAAPTPMSTAHCSGTLANDPSATPTSDDPNLVDYTFHCDSAITAYTVLANRRPWDRQTIDDFTSDVSILDPGGTPNATESITCSATLPGLGLNCNAGAGGQLLAWRTIGGAVDLTDPDCKTLPAGARPGTPATPQALVQFVVTDATGAEDGPFRLRLTTACPAVPDEVPAPSTTTTKSKKTPKKHKASGRSTTK